MLKRTDYSAISRIYDGNSDRMDIPVDPILQALVRREKPLKYLDLACGTGNNLKVQSERFHGEAIEWFGIDLSDSMLDIARSKLSDVRLSRGDASQLEFPDAYFDMVACNFAFHHFESKAEVLDNIQRVLKPEGYFRMRNIIPEFMKNWWVYAFCPATYLEDLQRFWEKDLIVYELEKRRFRIDVRVTYEENYQSLEKIRSDFIRRDTSQLANLDDAEYRSGLKKVENEIESGKIEMRNSFALLEIEARRFC
jgi:ubiquinone/menaquinone biosynthesis C-methylase UbiE